MTARRHRLSGRRPPECAGRRSRRPRSNRCESRCTACPRRSRKTPPSRADRTGRSQRRSRAAAVRRHRRTVAARTDRQEPAVPRRRDPAASRGTTRVTRCRFSRRRARQSTTGPAVRRPMPGRRRAPGRDGPRTGDRRSLRGRHGRPGCFLLWRRSGCGGRSRCRSDLDASMAPTSALASRASAPCHASARPFSVRISGLTGPCHVRSPVRAISSTQYSTSGALAPAVSSLQRYEWLAPVSMPDDCCKPEPATRLVVRRTRPFSGPR